MTSVDTPDYAYEAMCLASLTVEMGSQFHEKRWVFEKKEFANMMNIFYFCSPYHKTTLSITQWSRCPKFGYFIDKINSR